MTQPYNIKITRPQMAAAVARSGYLLEQRVFPVIEKAGYYVEANSVYPDPVTGKSREYDFSALTCERVYREEWDFLWVHLIGECVNNTQPLVFFSTGITTDFLFHEDIKCSGIPIKFPYNDDEDSEISFQDFFHLDKFHHYCHGPFSTQYCSFRQKKGNKTEWFAWHDDEHQGLFNTLVTATEYEIAEFYKSWDLPAKDEEEPLNINIYYPLLIIKGDLYECKQSRNKPVFVSHKHIQFRKPVISGQDQETFQIDVITESYLDKYLEITNVETDKIKTRLRRKKKDVRKSIDRIVTKARKARIEKKLKDFKKILEF